MLTVALVPCGRSPFFQTGRYHKENQVKKKKRSLSSNPPTAPTNHRRDDPEKGRRGQAAGMSRLTIDRVGKRECPLVGSPLDGGLRVSRRMVEDSRRRTIGEERRRGRKNGKSLRCVGTGVHLGNLAAEAESSRFGPRPQREKERRKSIQHITDEKRNKNQQINKK